MLRTVRKAAHSFKRPFTPPGSEETLFVKGYSPREVCVISTRSTSGSSILCTKDEATGEERHLLMKHSGWVHERPSREVQALDRLSRSTKTNPSHTVYIRKAGHK